MRITKTFMAALTVLFLVGSPASANPLEDGAEKFVSSLANEAITSLTGPEKARDERVAEFRRLFRDRFAVEVIGQFTLGRNWRQATEDERKEYLKLFEDLMVASYVDRFKNYAGEGLKIVKAVADDDHRATVHTDITRPNAADSKPVRVLWRVGRSADTYKVLDVVVEGASMSITLQREFSSVIRQTGSIAGLLGELRKKSADIEAAAKTN